VVVGDQNPLVGLGYSFSGFERASMGVVELEGRFSTFPLLGLVVGI